MIPNHKAAKLSELDMMIVNSVPPGGNWKNIPLDVPSKRIEQIRDSYAQGKGSRSTYYGRLLPDMPAYTINTYLTDLGVVAIFTMSKIVFYPREKLQDYNRSRMILFSSEVKQQLIPKSVMQCPHF